jgi:hypothetical protein
MASLKFLSMLQHSLDSRYYRYTRSCIYTQKLQFIEETFSHVRNYHEHHITCHK